MGPTLPEAVSWKTKVISENLLFLATSKQAARFIFLLRSLVFFQS